MFAMCYAAEVWNALPRPSHALSPFHYMFDKHSCYRRFYCFGSICLTKNLSGRKLATSIRCRFLGFSDTSKTYVVQLLHNRRLRLVRDIWTDLEPRFSSTPSRRPPSSPALHPMLEVSGTIPSAVEPAPLTQPAVEASEQTNSSSPLTIDVDTVDPSDEADSPASTDTPSSPQSWNSSDLTYDQPRLDIVSTDNIVPSRRRTDRPSSYVKRLLITATTLPPTSFRAIAGRADSNL